MQVGAMNAPYIEACAPWACLPPIHFYL